MDKAQGTVEASRVDLRKILDVMNSVTLHLHYRDKMNQHLHLAKECRNSPLTLEVESARDRLQEIVNE